MAENSPSIKKNLILSTLYQILLLVAPLITAPYVSRVLGVDKVGIYSYTNSIQMYFSMVAALGTLAYGGREIARVRNDKEKRTKLFWEIELLTVFTTTLCLIVWAGLILIDKTNSIYYMILTANLFSIMFDVSWFYTGLEQFKYTVTQNAIFKVLSIIAIFVFVKDKGDLAIYIAILSFSVMLGNMSMWIYLPKFLVKVKVSELRVFRHLKETIVYFIPTIATSIYTLLDKTLIGLITKSEAENGFYEQATKIINMTKAVTFSALNSVLGSRISFLYAENRMDEIKDKIQISVNYILFMGIGICFGLLGVSERFVPVFFGKGYDGVVPLLYLFSPIVIIIGLSNCLGEQYYTPAGLRAKTAKYIVAGACINFVMNLALIPLLRARGAVIASLIAEIVIATLFFRNSNGIVRLSQILSMSYKKIFAGLIMLLLIRIIGMNIGNDFVAIVVEIPTGAMIYGMILLVLKDSAVSELLKRIKK